jgi:hypothetical protein
MGVVFPRFHRPEGMKLKLYCKMSIQKPGPSSFPNSRLLSLPETLECFSRKSLAKALYAMLVW